MDYDSIVNAYSCLKQEYDAKVQELEIKLGNLKGECQELQERLAVAMAEGDEIEYLALSEKLRYCESSKSFYQGQLAKVQSEGLKADDELKASIGECGRQIEKEAMQQIAPLLAGVKEVVNDALDKLDTLVEINNGLNSNASIGTSKVLTLTSLKHYLNSAAINYIIHDYEKGAK